MKPRAPLETQHLDHDEVPASGPQCRAPAFDVAILDGIEGERVVVMLPDGTRAHADTAPGVAAELIAECLRERRAVLLRRSGERWLIVGALQTQASPIVIRDGVVTLKGSQVRVAAERRLDLEVGASRIELGRDGKLSLLGERLTMHVASLIKLIASKIELP